MGNARSHTETRVIQLTQELRKELRAEHTIRPINKSSSLDDLAIDSMTKTELFGRIEKDFHIKLPDSLLAEAETISDLINAIQSVKPAEKFQKREFVETLEKANVDVSKAKHLVDVLFAYAEQTPERPHIYLQDEYGNEKKITYGDLLESATSIAGALHDYGIRQGETIAIMLPTCAEFFFSFLGILLAGAIPVPIYPPLRASQIEEYAMREAGILRNAEVRILITFERAEMLSKLLRVFIPSLKAVTTASDLLAQKNKLPSGIELDGKDPALIQYTSGSTSAPKGVLLSSENVLANIRAYLEAIGIQLTDSCVSWLPLYHDMGLIGAWLGSFYGGAPVTIMSPLFFLARPERWLWSIHYHRATISAGPNFAYELCASKIEHEHIKGLDLSSWRLAFNGAEAVNPNTVRRFIKKFEPYGFKPTAFYPVYGLAETAVALTFPPLGREPKIDKIAREPFENEKKAILFSNHNDDQMLEFVSCGSALPRHEIRIVDDNNNPLKEREVGNLQFRGPSAMQGYYRNNAATQAIYHDGWWDTGDCAYIADNELYVTGRKKDLIIKSGRNLYPEEFEELAAQVYGIRKGCVAAFSVNDEKRGTEKLIIIAETKETKKTVRSNIINEIIEKIMAVIGIPPDEVILVKPRTIPKTSSGKLRRSTCKANYIKGKITKPLIPTWLQLARLFFIGISKKSIRFLSKLARIFYSIYLLFIGSIFSIIAIPIIFISPVSAARRWTKFFCTLVFPLILCPIKVIGKKNIPKDEILIYVANHASYLDALILTTALPPNIVFIAKSELQQTILGSLLKKLKCIFVERFDFSKSLDDAKKIQAAIEKRQSICIFPEGTFAYTSGLRPFKLGAFKIATDTGVAICPVSLKGTRHIIRENICFAKPNRVTVTIGEKLSPQEKSWDEMLRLMNKAREEIAKHCGEEILNL